MRKILKSHLCVRGFKAHTVQFTRYQKDRETILQNKAKKDKVRFHLSQPISRCPQELSKNLNIPLSEKMMHPFFSMPNGDLIHVPMPDAFCARTKMARTDLLSPICVATTKY